MAEVFGLASGALSIVGLAIQLLETAKKVNNLWELLKEASAEHKIISERLQDVRGLLEILAESPYDESHGLIIDPILKRCQHKLQELHTTVQNLRKPLTGSSFKRQIKVVFTEQKIQKLQADLQLLLADLTLALQVSTKSVENLLLRPCKGSFA